MYTFKLTEYNQNNKFWQKINPGLLLYYSQRIVAFITSNKYKYN